MAQALRPKKNRGILRAILRPLGIVLVSVLLYGVWLDVTTRVPRAWRTPAPTNSSPGMVSETGGADITPALPLSGVRTRMMNMERPPSETLMAIQQEFTKGNLSETARRLRQLGAEQSIRIGEAPFIVALWNNLGVYQHAQRKPDMALEAFRQAVRLDPASPVPNLNLAHMYWELRMPSLTHEFLTRVIQLNPDEPLPRLLMAELLLGIGDRAAAARQLNTGAVRKGIDPVLRDMAGRMLSRMQSDSSRVALLPPVSERRPNPQGPLPQTDGKQASRTTEDNPEMTTRAPTRQEESRPLFELPDTRGPESGSDHFVVKFVGAEDRDTWERIRAVLEYAYQDIGRVFGDYPVMPIAVVLHPDEDFLDLAGTPQWADMLFDAESGEIHLPLRGVLNDMAQLSRVVRHEFAHALLREKVVTPRGETPTWLMEGLAIHLADDSWPDLEAVEASRSSFIPLSTLAGSWNRLQKELLPLAYREAQVGTALLVNRHTLAKIRRVLSHQSPARLLETTGRGSLLLDEQEFRAYRHAQMSQNRLVAGAD